MFLTVFFNRVGINLTFKNLLPDYRMGLSLHV